jgi:hypothetical protein
MKPMRILEDLENILLQISESILIILIVVFFEIGFYFMGLVVFIGALIIWLTENEKVHLTAFWTFILTGLFAVIFLGDFLLGIIMMILAVGENYLRGGLLGDTGEIKNPENILSSKEPV